MFKNNSIEIEIADFQGVKPVDELHQFWYAVLQFSAFEFYLLLNSDINLDNHTKQSFTEKLQRKIAAHQYYGDDEYILFLDKDEILNSNSITCDFMGFINTGFSTKLKFELANGKVVGITFVEDQWDIEKVIDLYTLDQFQKRVFDKKYKS
jgi:hypothetical protein